MKLVVFDVNNAACSLITSPNNYAMMIDCGSHNEKDCPIDSIKTSYNKWLNITPFKTSAGVEYPLSLLHITHPDDDHVRNAKKVKKEFEPYLLRKRIYEDFPSDEAINEEYKDYIDKPYRGKNPEAVPWGFNQNKIFQIPMETILGDDDLSKKVKNNSSILRFVEYGGIKILFGGDLENDGWSWLAENNQDFIQTMSGGLDILIAPHHGHKSGFPKNLFDLTGNVKISILSKASESEKEDSDVSSQYAQYSDGITYKSLNDEHVYCADGVLTTRSNGNIFLKVDQSGNCEFFAQKASSNHSQLLNRLIQKSA